MVLWSTLREARRIRQEFSDDLREERANSDPDPPRRERSDRSDRPKPDVISRAETLRRRKRVRGLSSRAARPAGGEALNRQNASDSALVRCALKMNRCESRQTRVPSGIRPGIP